MNELRKTDKDAASSEPVQIDPRRQQQAVSFARDIRKATKRYAFTVAVLIVLTGIFLFQTHISFSWTNALLSTVFAVPVLSWQPVVGWPPFLVLTSAILVSMLLLAVYQPYVWYINFVIPRRYGRNMETTVLSWLRVRCQVLLIKCVKAWLLIELVTLLIVIQPRMWWVWTTLIQFLFFVLWARFSPHWLYNRLSKAYPLPEGEIAERFHVLLERVPVPTCNVLVAPVRSTNGRVRVFCTGWGKGRCIVLTSNLLGNFTSDEVEVILAHELAHLVHHDMWKRLVISSLRFLGLFFLLSCALASFPIVRDTLSHTSLIPLLLSIEILLGCTWCVLFAYRLLIMRYKRYQEYQADEFALQMTGNVQAFKNAMIRLTNLGMSVAGRTRYSQYSTHPTLIARLKHADEFAVRAQTIAGQAKDVAVNNA